MLEETQETAEIIERVAALDVGKAELTCCVRVPGQGGSGPRLQEVRTYQTMTRSLLAMADRLGELGVTRVVMEATSDYWKAPFYLLEAHGFEVWLVNARDVKHLPGRPKTDRLDEITGVGRTAAQVILAEIGTDMGRFPTAGHLASWAKFTPGVKESAGKKKGKSSTGHGNRYLARVLGEAAVAAGRTDTFLGERYRRIARRRGTKRAIVAVGRSILVIVWHLLADPTARFCDLGPDFYDTRINAERKKRNHIRQLEALGYKVTLQPAA